MQQRLEARAEATPDRIAVVFEDQRLTYAELNRRANRLANYLRRLGVGREVLVGIYLERSADMVVGLLGILKTGGAYVPLDPAYPKDRLSFMMKDAGVAVLLTRQVLAAEFLDTARQVVCIDQDWSSISQESGEDPPNGYDSETLCYVIYTSGSTGKPKGVQILNRAVVNFLSSMQQEPGLTAEDLLLSVTTMSFDIAVLEILLPLITGATLLVVSREVALDGSHLLDELSRSGATVMQATPATWRLLLRAGWQGDQKLRMLCGGEALSLDLAAQLLHRGACLWNMYGPTETTVWSTLQQVKPADARMLVGHPISSTQICVLSDRLEAAPTGEVGELYIGGDGLARGYLNRPQLTAERFIPDPNSHEHGSRLYSTGDLGRLLPDGTTECLGRMDHQIKIRGFRVELGEIESSLRLHPAVRDAVAAVGVSHAGDRRLVSYILLEQPSPFPNRSAMARELRGFLLRTLPEYMVPAAFVELEKIPVTPNGKVDRSALPSIDSANSVQSGSIADPRDPLEHQLREIWETLLATRPIGIRDNFFELGGDSLLAAQMIEGIENACGRRLAVNSLHSGATIEHIANLLVQEEKERLQSPLMKIQPHGSKNPFFFLHGDFNGGGFYCLKLARHLGTDQPFYTLPPHGIDEGQIPKSIEETAERRLKNLLAFRPRGPYLLGGFCNGALVAFEMARRLEKQGEKVELLVLIYASANNPKLKLLNHLVNFGGWLERLTPERRRDRFLRLRSRVLQAETRFTYHVGRVRELARSGISEQKKFITRGTSRTITGVDSVKESRAGGNLRGLVAGEFATLNDNGQDPLSKNRQKLTSEYDKLMNSYIPQSYGGSITLFWPEEALEEIRSDPTAGWGRVARRRVETHTIPGRHLTCITRHGDALAERLKLCLQKVDEP